MCEAPREDAYEAEEHERQAAAGHELAVERIRHGALQVDHGHDIQRQKSEYVCQVVERRWVRDLQTRVAGAQLCCA